MTSDVSWSTTIEHIKATNLVSPALAQREFGFFLSTNGFTTSAAAELIARQFGLDPSLAPPSLTFAEQTNQFLAQIAHEDPQQKMWSFLSYMRQNSLQSDDANARVVESLGEKIGFELGQRTQIVIDLKIQQTLAVLPYAQVDTFIYIYGVPDSAKVKAYSYDSKDDVDYVKLSTGTWRVNIFGASSGLLEISRTYDEFGNLGGMVQATWSVTTAGTTFATFRNQFGFPGKLPVGSYVDKAGDIHLIKGEQLNLAKSAYLWAKANPRIYTNLTGVQSGNKQDIDNLIDDFKVYYNRESEKWIDISYSSIQRAHSSHVAKKNAWNKREVQEVFQSAIKLSTLLSKEIQSERLYFTGQANPDGRADEYTDSVTKVLKRHISGANYKIVSDALASAMLSDGFRTLLAEAKGGSLETMQNAQLALSAFDPKAAAAVLDTEFLVRGTANFRAFLPSAKASDDPNSYVSYLVRRVLTDKTIGPEPSKKAVQDAGIAAALVYGFGIIRELVPAAKIFSLSEKTMEKIISDVAALGTIVEGRTVWKVPNVGRKKFSQDVVGAMEYGLARYSSGVSLGFTSEQRNLFAKRTEFLEHTNSWMPLVSLALRATQLGVGDKSISRIDKNFIIARIVADLMSFAGYIYHHGDLVGDIARRLGGSASTLLSRITPLARAIETATDYVRPVFAGFSWMRFNLSALDISRNYLIRPFVKVLAAAGPIVGELVGELADLVYGGVNIISGSLQIARGKLLKGTGLLLYGIINFVSGAAFTVFTVRGIVTKQHDWAIPFRAASFWLQIAASLANGYLASISAKEAADA